MAGSAENSKKNLDKAGLAHLLSESTRLGEKTAYEVIGALCDIVARNLAAGNSVRISNFMSIERVEKPSRMARNPRTGERFRLPERKAVRVIVSPRLHEVANLDDPNKATVQKKSRKVASTSSS